MLLNKWHCYEYMKQVYMRTGKAPTRAELLDAFPELPRSAVEEGYQEFQATVYGRRERSGEHV